MQVVAGTWPRMNLATPDLQELLRRVAEELIAQGDPESQHWREWIVASPQQLEAAVEVFRRVSTGVV